MREGQQHLSALEPELLLQTLEHAVAHPFWHALEIAGDQHHATSLVVLKRQNLQPEVVQLAVGWALRPVACEPDRFLRRDDCGAHARLPARFLGSCRTRLTAQTCGRDAEPQRARPKLNERTCRVS